MEHHIGCKMIPKYQSGRIAEITEYLRYYLLTYGFGKMEKPINLLSRWLLDKPSKTILLNCHDSQMRELLDGLFSIFEFDYKHTTTTGKRSIESTYSLNIPKIQDRLEDLPLLTEYFLADLIQTKNMVFPGLRRIFIAPLFFLCHRHDSPAGNNFAFLDLEGLKIYLTELFESGTYDINTTDFILYCMGSDDIVLIGLNDLHEYPDIEQIYYRDFQHQEPNDPFDVFSPFDVFKDKRIKIRLEYANNLFELEYYIEPINDDEEENNDENEFKNEIEIKILALAEYRDLIWHFTAQWRKKINLLRIFDNKYIPLDEIQDSMIQIGRDAFGISNDLPLYPKDNIYQKQKDALKQILLLAKGKDESITVSNAIRDNIRIPGGCTFEDIKVSIVDNHTINVYFPQESKPKRYSYKDFGAENRNTKKPKKQWDHFINCLDNNGVLECVSNPQLKDARKKMKSNIKNMLCSFFGIKDDPFHPYKKNRGWELKMQIK